VRTIHILRSGRNYFVDGIYWGDDAESVVMYLRAKGVPAEHIQQALEGVVREGMWIIRQE
jgi:hypothetical protein